MRRVAAGLILTASLSGCSHAHSVAWFKKHPHALQETLKKCKSVSAGNANCHAATVAWSESELAAPPVKFNGENMFAPTHLPLNSKGVGY